MLRPVDLGLQAPPKPRWIFPSGDVSTHSTSTEAAKCRGLGKSFTKTQRCNVSNRGLSSPRGVDTTAIERCFRYIKAKLCTEKPRKPQALRQRTLSEEMIIWDSTSGRAELGDLCEQEGPAQHLEGH